MPRAVEASVDFEAAFMAKVGSCHLFEIEVSIIIAVVAAAEEDMASTPLLSWHLCLLSRLMVKETCSCRKMVLS